MIALVAALAIAQASLPPSPVPSPTPTCFPQGSLTVCPPGATPPAGMKQLTSPPCKATGRSTFPCTPVPGQPLRVGVTPTAPPPDAKNCVRIPRTAELLLRDARGRGVIAWLDVNAVWHAAERRPLCWAPYEIPTLDLHR